MQTNHIIEIFHLLGKEIKSFLKGSSKNQKKWNDILQLAEQENPWFTKDNMFLALENIYPWFEKNTLIDFLSDYKIVHHSGNRKNIGVVMAGNIPLVGFHDFLCVLLSGNTIYAKLSHSDKVLLPFIAEFLIENEPTLKDRINFVENFQPSTFKLDAIIATGSNNSARHFEYYFRSIPHIIRKNRNGIAILNGIESRDELTGLGSDIFNYFGLGCRNVSKLFVPSNYQFDNFFKAIEKYKVVINHTKYHSNYVYNRTIYLMDDKKFYDNGFLLVLPNNEAISSPIAVLNYEEYENEVQLKEKINGMKTQIQCVVSNKVSGVRDERSVMQFGKTQSPSINDYADGVDVMKFISELS